MTKQSALRNLLVKLGLLHADDLPRDGSKKARGKREPQAIDKTLMEFEKRLGKILLGHQTETSDRVYLIEFQKIQEKMGANWERSSHKIHVVIKGILERYLTEQDLYIQRDDVSYLIVFATLGSKEAQLKCTLIGEEVAGRLVGRETMLEFVEVKGVTVQDDGEVQFGVPLDSKKLMEGFGDRQGDVSQEEEGAPGAATDADGGFGLGVTGIQFIFRPLLAIRTGIISTFLCLPVREGARGFTSGYDVLLDPSDTNEILELDKLTLRRTSAALDELFETKKRSLVALPVHFETLADQNMRSHYLSHCAAAFADRQNRVVYEIVGLPDGVPQTRLLDLASAVRPHARAVMARFALEHTSFPAFRTAGLHAVGVDIYSTDEREKVIMKKMSDFVQSAKKNNLKTYILGVRTISLYTATVTEGFDYLAGYALTDVSKTAEDIYPFPLEMPYSPLLESAGSSVGK